MHQHLLARHPARSTVRSWMSCSDVRTWTGTTLHRRGRTARYREIDPLGVGITLVSSTAVSPAFVMRTGSIPSLIRLSPVSPAMWWAMWNRPRILENIEALDREAYAMVRAYLEARAGELDVANLDLAAFVCVQTAETLTHAAVVQRTDTLTDGDAQAFIDEVTRLITYYLIRRHV